MHSLGFSDWERFVQVYITKWEDRNAHLITYLNAAIPGLAERHDRILLSHFENNLMMLIPPPFLVKTPSLHYYVPVYGTNHLKLRVRCYPSGQSTLHFEARLRWFVIIPILDELPHSIPTAEWQKWPNVMWKPPTPRLVDWRFCDSSLCSCRPLESFEIWMHMELKLPATKNTLLRKLAIQPFPLTGANGTVVESHLHRVMVGPGRTWLVAWITILIFICKTCFFG